MNYELGNKLQPLKANDPYAHWEIRRCQPNPYYQSKEDYLARGYYYTHDGECVSNGSHTIDVSLLNIAELKTTIAYWVSYPGDFRHKVLQLVDDRLFEMSEDEQLKFLKLAKIAHAEIQNQLDSQVYGDL
jgi:hypothetical protein